MQYWLIVRQLNFFIFRVFLQLHNIENHATVELTLCGCTSCTETGDQVTECRRPSIYFKSPQQRIKRKRRQRQLPSKGWEYQKRTKIKKKNVKKPSTCASALKANAVLALPLITTSYIHNEHLPFFFLKFFSLPFNFFYYYFFTF